jgi:ribulose-phosphate 3-epimerase
MNPTICPTIMGKDEADYKGYMDVLARFATRIHIDLTDGTMAPTRLLPVDRVWWPGGMRADMHVMYQRPFDYLDVMLAMRPQLIVVHAEADGDFVGFARRAHAVGIETGVALQAETPVEQISGALEYIDHVQIFAGKLGYFGGDPDLELLGKVKQLKQLKPQLEIGWDGGINDQNAKALAEGGVDVLNVGGFIHDSQNPAAAYLQLVGIISGRQRTDA